MPKVPLPASEPVHEPHPGWRRSVRMPSLPEVFSSVHVPEAASFWRKLLAFSGPGLMVAVGYMDPGNWATDLAGGARFGYTLLSVVLISNFMAILLQPSASGFEGFAYAAMIAFAVTLIVSFWVLFRMLTRTDDDEEPPVRRR